VRVTNKKTGMKGVDKQRYIHSRLYDEEGGFGFYIRPSTDQTPAD